jgi:hypothetical protein
MAAVDAAVNGLSKGSGWSRGVRTWSGQSEACPVANACESQGTLRFAPATLTQISREVITRHFFSLRNTSYRRSRHFAKERSPRCGVRFRWGH